MYTIENDLEKEGAKEKNVSVFLDYVTIETIEPSLFDGATTERIYSDRCDGNQDAFYDSVYNIATEIVDQTNSYIKPEKYEINHRKVLNKMTFGIVAKRVEHGLSIHYVGPEEGLGQFISSMVENNYGLPEKISNGKLFKPFDKYKAKSFIKEHKLALSEEEVERINYRKTHIAYFGVEQDSDSDQEPNGQDETLF